MSPQGEGADCNSVGETHAWFDSKDAHHKYFCKGSILEQIFLAILFSIGGEITFIEGWMPLPVENQDICEIRKSRLQEQVDIIFDSSNSNIEVAAIICGTQLDIQHQINILNSELL